MEDLQSLRYLLAGGDVLSAVHVKKVLNAFPGIRVINGYILQKIRLLQLVM